MWELYYKEAWCIWTVVLEKALESPLDSKEIKPVNPKGNQPWIFTGRTDAEAEASILWPPDTKSWLFWKDPDAGKDWRQEEKSTVEGEIVSIINSVDMNLSKLWETVKDRDAWRAVHGVSRSWTWLPREQSVSFRIPGFCLVLFRLLCPKISCLFIAKTLLCFSPKPTLPMFITGCPVWAKDWLLCLAWVASSCRVLCRVRENILLSNPGHILFPDVRPRALVVSEPFCEALASPLPQCWPFSTLRESSPVQRDGQGVDMTPFLQLLPLSFAYLLPIQTSPFSPFKSRLPAAGKEAEVLCMPTMSVPQSSLKLPHSFSPGYLRIDWLQVPYQREKMKKIGKDDGGWRTSHQPL